jgi:hypothetical protein
VRAVGSDTSALAHGDATSSTGLALTFGERLDTGVTLRYVVGQEDPHGLDSLFPMKVLAHCSSFSPNGRKMIE